mgnify:CR=1 FL=1
MDIIVGRNQKISHILYKTKEEAREAYKPVAILKALNEHWIVRFSNYRDTFYAVMPKATFQLLRHSEFSIQGARYDISRVA